MHLGIASSQLIRVRGSSKKVEVFTSKPECGFDVKKIYTQDIIKAY